jgi:glycosyltransferase involved in cell wall biosynthesis
MATGVPVVMSNRGALPELAGADAAVVDPTDSDAIADELKRALQRRYDQHLIKERVEHAGQFRWKRTAQETSKLIREVLAR